MKSETKIKKLKEVDEKTLRESILMPLLAKMNFQAVTLYHGPQERGKDIVCYKPDVLGVREYLAVVAKASDLDGSVSSSDGLREVLHQVSQCFDNPYDDLFGMTQVTMHRVWVVTSKRIVPGASESVYASLEKQNLSKLVRFIPGNDLIELIDKHYPEFWDTDVQSIDVLREQKERLYSFCFGLLSSLGAKSEDIQATLNQVQNSYFPPAFECPATRTLARLSPYVVEIDQITEKYSHDFHTYACGTLREMFSETKQKLYRAMYDVDEAMQNYESIMKLSDPREFVTEFEEKLADAEPFRNTYGSAGDVVVGVDYLRQGIDEVDELTERLTAAGKLEWATNLVDSVALLSSAVADFLKHIDKEKFALFWKIDELEGKAKVSLLFSKPEDMENVIETAHDKTVKDLSYRRRTDRPVTVNEILNIVGSKLRELLQIKFPEPEESSDEKQ